jgi:hypothetical protein
MILTSPQVPDRNGRPIAIRLDATRYRSDWISRRALYRDADLEDRLPTTDDRTVVRQERIDVVIREIVSGELPGEPRASLHHCGLGT